MLFNQIIAEDAASDRVQRNQARRILRTMAARLADVKPRSAVWTTYRRSSRTPVELKLVWTPLTDLSLPQYADLAIGYMQSHGSMSGSIIDLDAARKSGEGVPFPDTVRYFIAYPVTQYVPDNFTMLRRICQDGSPTLLHELIHYLDHRRGLPGASGGKGTDADYYNDPGERNAYYQMAMATIDRRPAAWFAVPPRRWIRTALKTFERDFLTALTPEHRNRLAKRLYGLWASRQPPRPPASGRVISERIVHRDRHPDQDGRRTVIAVNPTPAEWDRWFPHGAAGVLCSDGRISHINSLPRAVRPRQPRSVRQ